MDYWRLRNEISDKRKRRRVTNKLKLLRQVIADTIPTQTTDSNLVLGTWNIRNFDDNRFGEGPRLPESFFYIAEIISAFDVIAIQEVCDDLGPLKRLMSILGKDYEFILTDVTEGRPGNQERLGFIFNRHKVWFKGIAGEIVLPHKLLIDSKNKRLQLARTPFAVEFQSRWFKFNFATVHIYYGSSSKKSDAYAQRVKEIQAIANFLGKRADKESKKFGVNYVLVGDFNIDALGDKAYNALTKAGFEVFKNREGSNKTQTKYYDQISFKARPGQVILSDIFDEKQPYGVFNAFDVIFRDDEFDHYEDDVRSKLSEKKRQFKKELVATTSKTKGDSLKKRIAAVEKLQSSKIEREKYYLKKWRTYQISDHLPLWVDLQVDFTDNYLDRLAQE